MQIGQITATVGETATPKKAGGRLLGDRQEKAPEDRGAEFSAQFSADDVPPDARAVGEPAPEGQGTSTVPDEAGGTNQNRIDTPDDDPANASETEAAAVTSGQAHGPGMSADTAWDPDQPADARGGAIKGGDLPKRSAGAGPLSREAVHDAGARIQSGEEGSNSVPASANATGNAQGRSEEPDPALGASNRSLPPAALVGAAAGRGDPPAPQAAANAASAVHDQGALVEGIRLPLSPGHPVGDSARTVPGAVDEVPPRTSPKAETLKPASKTMVSQNPAAGTVAVAGPPAPPRKQKSSAPGEVAEPVLFPDSGPLSGATSRTEASPHLPAGRGGDIAAARTEAARVIAAQLAPAAADARHRPVEITLYPEELGRVRMVLSATETGMVLSISGDRPETMDLMRRHIDQLAQEFRRMGYADTGFEFTGGDRGWNRSGQQAETQMVEHHGPVPDPATLPPSSDRSITSSAELDIRL